MWNRLTLGLTAFALLGASVWFAARGKAPEKDSLELLNVSYDPTRELWRDLNDRFISAFSARANGTSSLLTLSW